MKILIISHNALSTYQNMGKSMLALFSRFKSEEVCQLYIYPSIPDVNKCSSYYRITDKDVLHNWLRCVRGKEVSWSSDAHSLFEDSKDEEVYRDKKNKSPFRMLLRDFLWKTSHWLSKDLLNWIKKEAPTSIFVAPGQAKFLYDMALTISRKFHLSIVTYICDDYYFLKPSDCLWGGLQHKLLTGKIEQLMSKSCHLVAISEEIGDAFAGKFQKPAKVIMTGSSYPIATEVKVKQNPTHITYMGNIRRNRFYSLVDVGKVIDEINAERNTDYKLNIYTFENDKEILNNFKEIKSICLCGSVTGVEFDRVFHSSELLLHVEAFDANSIDLVKRSVSTKIADSLGSGIPLIAYGPGEVSSMLHLKRNQCALIAENKADLKKALIDAFDNLELKYEIAKNELLTARKYHDSQITGEEFYNLMWGINENPSSKFCL